MSHDSPTLDEQHGAGAEAADAEAQHQSAIFDELVAECEYQQKRWGTAFDNKNTVNDWAAYTNLYMGRATQMGAAKEAQRLGMLKAAAILIAAVEAFDRNDGFAPRHYDQ